MVCSGSWKASLKAKELWEFGKAARRASSKHPPSTLRKISRYIKGPAWLSRELMTELQRKQALYRRWKQGQAARDKLGNFLEHAVVLGKLKLTGVESCKKQQKQ